MQKISSNYLIIHFIKHLPVIKEMQNNANSFDCREDLNTNQYIISSIQIDDTLKNRCISKLREAKKAIDNFENYLNIENTDNIDNKLGTTRIKDSLSLVKTTTQKLINKQRPINENDDNLGLGTKKALNVINFRRAFEIKKDISRFLPSKNKLHLMNYERGEAELIVNILDKIKIKRDEKIRVNFYKKNIENLEKLENSDEFKKTKTTHVNDYYAKSPKEELNINSFKKMSNTNTIFNKFEFNENRNISNKTSNNISIHRYLSGENKKKLTQSNNNFNDTYEFLSKNSTREFRIQSPIFKHKLNKNFASPLITNDINDFQNYKKLIFDSSFNFKKFENSLTTYPKQINYKIRYGKIQENNKSLNQNSSNKKTMKEIYQKAVPKKFNFKSLVTDQSNNKIKNNSRNEESFPVGFNQFKKLPERFKKNNNILISLYKVLEIEQQKANLMIKTNTKYITKKNLTFN